MSRGPGWWLASDGRWYPPEVHPARGQQAVPEAPPRSPGGLADRAASSTGDGRAGDSAPHAPPLNVEVEATEPLPPFPGAPLGVAPKLVLPPGARPIFAGSDEPSGSDPWTPRGAPERDSTDRPDMMHVATDMARTTRREYTWTRDDAQRLRDAPTSVYSSTARRGAGIPKVRHDVRGIFAGGCAALVLVATLFPWYSWFYASPTGAAVTRSLRIYTPGYRGWYLAIPVVAGAVLVVGAISSLMRLGQPGYPFVFILVRVLALALVVLMVVAVFAHPLQLPKGITALTTVSKEWAAWVALGFSVIGLLGTLASGWRTDKD